MATAQVGIRGNNAVVPYNAATKRTKQLTLTVTSAQAGWSTTRAVGIVYADSAGVWRLRFNIAGSFTAVGAGALNFACTVANITTAATTQALAAVFTSATPVMRAYTSGSDGVLNVRAVDGNAADGVRIFGDIELASEPTALTLAANMEGAVSVDVYVPEASATVAGIVNTGTQNFAGNKTFDTDTLVIDASNNRIGVSVASPAYKWQANESANSRTYAACVQNSGVSTVGSSGSGLLFKFSGAEPASIEAILTNGTSGAGRLSFYTTPDGTKANFEERMRIDSDGAVSAFKALRYGSTKGAGSTTPAVLGTYSGIAADGSIIVYSGEGALVLITNGSAAVGCALLVTSPDGAGYIAVQAVNSVNAAYSIGTDTLAGSNKICILTGAGVGAGKIKILNRYGTTQNVYVNVLGGIDITAT